MTPDRSDELLALTADIVAAHVANNQVGVDDLATLISSVHQALGSLGDTAQAPAEPRQPAVSIRSSVKPDHIVCLEDGRKLKTLRRYLKSHYGMTPEEYRAKWNLPADYPMVAPNYSATRKALAEKMGLGRKPADATPPEEAAQPAEVAPVQAEPQAEAPPPVEAAPAPAEPAPVAPPRRKVLKPLFARKDDSAGERSDGQASDSAPTPPVAILCAAIARHICVATTYNKRSVILAPHLVFTRHGEPYLRAVTVEQDGRKPREEKLGTFKLAGLGAVSITNRSFVRFPSYPADEQDHAENLLCALPTA